MRLLRFSKRNLKRNKPEKKLFFCLLLFISAMFPSMAISTDVMVGTSEEISVSCMLYEADINQLIQSLKKGYRSEITIEIQLFKRREIPYSILGDILIHEIEYTKNSEKDFGSDSYTVKEGANKKFFNSENSFLDYYFSNTIEIPPEYIIVSELSKYYVKIKTTLVYRLYVQPFNIFNLTNFRDRSTSGWLIINFLQDSQ